MSVQDISKKYRVDIYAAKWAALSFTLAGTCTEYDDAYAKLTSSAEIMFGVYNGMGKSIAAMANLVIQVRSVRDSGEQVFSISPELIGALTNTDIRNIPVDMVKFPYKGFYVDFGSFFTSEDGRITNGAYVKIEDDRIRILSINSSANKHDINDVMYEHYKVMTSGCETYGDVIDRQTSDRLAENAVYMDAVDSTLSLFVNLALYLNCESVDRKVSPKVKQLSRSKKKPKVMFNSMRVTQLGYNYKGDNMSTENVSQEGGMLTRRHVVRGHWRNQACGTGRKDRKLLFVKPHFKGPDVGETLKRKYC